LTPRQISSLEAVRNAIAIEMRANPRIIIFGEGTGKRGGSFAHTKGLYDEFGPERLIDTPISELGFTGAAIGAALMGMHPIADLMFADFISEAMSQLINQASKQAYMSNGALRVPLVVRAAMGSVKGAAAHHSGCLYPLFIHIPGLKVVTYSTPADGYGLMRSALREPNPVIFLDHKALFAVKGDAPDDDMTVPLGKARVVREGTQITVVAAALMVHRALEAAAMLGGVAVEIIDPRTLAPLDLDAIFTSVKKTGRLLIVDESYPSCSFASEVAAQAASELLYDLDAPIRRINSKPITHPFSPVLTEAMIPQAQDIAMAIEQILEE
jgi:2-oxoisovalerate dehydrogenase E1 component